jgi:ABC-type tungstate transport system substrate-binding protein
MIAVAVVGQPGFSHLAPGQFMGALKAGLQVIEQGDEQVVNGQIIDLQYTMINTLRLALDATGYAALLGIPVGCILGLGRFRGRRGLLAIGNALTRVPPVVVGVFIVLTTTAETGTLGASRTVRTFNGPLTSVIGHSFSTPLFTIYFGPYVVAQGLLALPIIITLTATALQRVPVSLLDQAEAFGASRRRRSMLALREARSGVLAGIIVAFGITITAVGAIYLLGGDQGGCAATFTNGQSCARQGSLSYGALSAWQSNLPMTQIAIAYAELLMGMFLVSAAALTFLQQSRTTWIAGAQS